MMAYRTVKAALEALLTANANGRFTVIGNQEQAQRAENVKGSLRSVQVFYKSGNFDKSGSSLRGPVVHELTLALELTLGAPVKIDLETINDPNSLPADRALAIANSKRAHRLADESFDEFAELIFQIIMDARNQDFGLDDYTIGSRWIGSIQKDDPIRTGQYVILTGALMLTCRVSEEVLGDTGDELNPIIDTVLDLYGDDNEKTGVIVELQ